MSDAHTLPDDLSPDEAALLEALRRPADARAALAIRVRREHRRLTKDRGMSYQGALDEIGTNPAFPVARDTARDIVQGRRSWAVRR